MSFPKKLRGGLPRTLRSWLRRRHLDLWPPRGYVRFGSLRRRRPIGAHFGVHRGQCIDRYYIAAFLAGHRADVRGAVLEIGEALYTRRYGGADVMDCQVLHVAPGHPGATLTGDLESGQGIPNHHFDCVILTQTLQFIFDTRAALASVKRALRPGGVALMTVPGIAQISDYDRQRWGEYWRFTSQSLERLFAEIFPDSTVTVRAYGNVLSAISLLHGISAGELSARELDYVDSEYEVLLGVRVKLPG